MDQAGKRILSKMLDRLFAAIVNGPNLNCRPHNSRQRVDLTSLARLGDLSPADALRRLLSEPAAASIAAKVPAPSIRATGRLASGGGGASIENETPEQAAARRAWTEQQSLLSKLRTLVDEARTYEDDTGVSVLNLGFPLLSLPPGAIAGRGSGTRRVLAPIAFVPLSLTVRAGAGGSAVELSCRGEDVDRVVPNEALLAWLEQQTGKSRGELFSDEEGGAPWKEIAGLVRHVAGVLGIQASAAFAGDELPETLGLVAAPKSDEGEGKAQIVPAAVLGLYPMANQGLLRDTREMVETGVSGGPIQSFLKVDASLAPPTEEAGGERAPSGVVRKAKEERLVAQADPCQARAVSLAQTSMGLVIHGPPGTGKSQTITNIIGDHLARGERVLFVCDKRTALDVVANRLEHLGLGSLCAVIHDPQRDQRELYRSVREQIETLTESATHPKAETTVAQIDQELEKLHTDLAEVHRGLMSGLDGEPSLHELIGQWLALTPATDGPETIASGALKDAKLAELDGAEMELRDVLGRALAAAYEGNPWVEAAGLGLHELVSRPMDQFRAGLDAAVRAAVKADETRHESIPAFAADLPLEAQAAARERLAGILRAALAADGAIRSAWAGKDAKAWGAARRVMQEAAAAVELVRRESPDAELMSVVREAPPPAPEIARRLGVLEAYLPAARAWWGFLALGKKAAAAKVLTPLGLPVNAEGAERGRKFYRWLRAARSAAGALEQIEGRAVGAGLPDREVLDVAWRGHEAVLAALAGPAEDPALRALGSAAAAAVGADGAAAGLLDGLDRSRARAAGLAGLEEAAKQAGLLSGEWLTARTIEWRGGDVAAPTLAALRERLPSLEDVLRVKEGLAELPASLATAAAELVARSAVVEKGLRVLRRGVVEAEAVRRLTESPQIRALDARRMQTMFERYAELEARKRDKVRDAIVHRWVSRQKERLLAGTGSRLNSAGAEVRRRLTIRGRNAMRLRQVLSMGRNAEGGDPLLDLRPVWMASPETVAQVFPRDAVFDVVVFDEASQCRLEEALPVLTRAKRVVIAGDPKQLPPTRFFESAVAQSEAEEITSDQDLFEAQQGEVEDLLGAALGLDVQQSYLDVHYRSRNSDLISFSNQQFYSSRLQPIPGHPKNRARFCPVTMYRVQGIYDKRTNVPEAEQVVRIVRDLLKRAKPPSIGIGCFNLAQRDLITEKLEELAAEDKGFASALAAARSRRGQGAAEGLFVKNLENIQGDERDHIIISTTYGPDPQGRFYKRFGPLGMPGGGRRLNVLVTRAREEVHVVTSIPPEVYRALPPVPQGQTPGGGWLLFAYLQFAEGLAIHYERVRRALANEEALADAEGAEQDEPVGNEDELIEELTIRPAAEVFVAPTRAPSILAAALGERLAIDHGLGSIIHWGNDGFCVDVALRHPTRPEDVTIGVLCDLTRFPLADDPVEWDLFRTAVLRGQGWDLHRVWSPALFRDARGGMETLFAKAREAAKEGEDPDAIRVERGPV